MLPHAATIYLTNHCYLKCRHCFLLPQLNTTQLDYYTVLKFLDFLKLNKTFMVAYTGGDCLLHPEIFKIIEETKNRNMMPLLGASGISITQQIAKKIYSSGVRCVQVSIDGSCEEVNSIFRGQNTLNEIIESVKIMQQQGIFVNIATCLCVENFHDYKNIINLCYELNAYKIKLQMWNPFGKVNKFITTLNKRQKEEIYTFSKEFEKKHALENWIDSAGFNSELSKIHNSSYELFPNGDLNIGNSYIGNINNENIYELMS